MTTLDMKTFPLRGQHLIEASAGTGKTYTITNLYLRLLLGRDESMDRPLTVDKILVLTFTIAATEELRDRIRRRIDEARLAFSAGTKDPFLQWLIDSSRDPARDVRLLAGAVQLMDEAAIYTIHGFCARVLSDNAFETGTLFDQALDADRDELIEQATRDCFRADLLPQGDLARGLALDAWSSPDDLSKSIKPYLSRHALALQPDAAPVNENDLEDRIRLAKRRWIDEGFGKKILDEEYGFSQNKTVYTRAAAMTEWCGSGGIVSDQWEFWLPEKYRAGVKKGYEAPESDLPELIETIERDMRQLSINLWHLVLNRIRVYLARYKIEQSKLTIDDLLTQVFAAQQAAGGETLSLALAERWPFAMIDEFQDTDDVQWAIFSNIWQRFGEGLLLIGDPKQAIYQFRGADVYTYINAKRSIPSHFSLDTNWRSRTSLVDAMNVLFDQPEVFGNDADIPFEPVKASPGADRLTMTVGGTDVPPVSLFTLPKGSKEKVLRLAMAHAAEEVSKLLAGGRGETLINGKPIDAGQIAILVRSKRDARAARDALAERSIGSVYVTLESVFLTDTADDLRLILHAVLEPTNLGALRAALATPLLQMTAQDVEALNDDIDIQQKTIQEFADYHRAWSDMDVATMVGDFIRRRRIAQKWAARPDGERQLTNLRHLTELLQQRASVAPGMHRLFKWFSREKREASTVASDERQLRLESDRDLVKIVTMHASKGLQYEVVMIPMGTFMSRSPSKRDPALVHHESGGAFETVLHVDNDEHAHADMLKEQFDEETRLLYVAITRARHRCYIGLPEYRGSAKAAASKLIGGSDLDSRWQPPLFDIRYIESVGLTPFEVTRDTATLKPPGPLPTIDRDWRVHSYTGVSRQIGNDEDAGTVTEQRGFNDDDEAAPAAASNQFNRFAFPRGPRVGVALHTLMEHLDFTLPATDQQALLDQCLSRVGLTEDRETWQKTLIAWVDDIRQTPIEGFALADIDRQHRLDEMEFHFPLHAAAGVLDTLKSFGYFGERGVRTPPLTGLMTGMIDLVFEHEGRFWIVDYKSNHLGNTFADYLSPQLDGAMAHHLYDLQYLIYAVALDRYLQTRVPDYRFETHFGGACYLFLRGMQGEGKSTGVFVDRPSAETINALSEALSISNVA